MAYGGRFLVVDITDGALVGAAPMALDKVDAVAVPSPSGLLLASDRLVPTSIEDGSVVQVDLRTRVALGRAPIVRIDMIAGRACGGPAATASPRRAGVRRRHDDDEFGLLCQRPAPSVMSPALPAAISSATTEPTRRGYFGREEATTHGHLPANVVPNPGTVLTDSTPTRERTRVGEREGGT
ncbi:hypothetical protein ACGFIR_30380 [Micromonospora sp. NPDC049051]|uniref:hypothetical protein n=1 Tax=Micromonospora sp. NPDC049051 TaxID=3364264 RepID=UPI0037148171